MTLARNLTRLALIAVICLSFSGAAFQADKLEYIVGGSSAEVSDLFSQKWRPILEKYLTDSVGPQYEPNIRFKLLLVDYDPNERAQQMAQDGILDFVCACTEHTHFTHLFHSVS
jgi:hypothetical protein